MHFDCSSYLSLLFFFLFVYHPLTFITNFLLMFMSICIVCVLWGLARAQCMVGLELPFGDQWSHQWVPTKNNGSPSPGAYM